MPVSARPRELATQSLPGAPSRLSGPAPAGTVCTTLASSSLRRNSTSSGVTAAHTDPFATVSALIQPCSVARAAIRLSSGSIFSTTPFSLLAAQMLPSAKVTSVAVTGSAKRRCTCPVAASTRTTSAPLATQTDPAPAAMPVGSEEPGAARVHRPAVGDPARAGVDPHQSGATLLGDEHGVACGRHSSGHERQLHRAHLPAPRHVDLGEPLRGPEQGPGGAAAEDEVARPLGQRHAAVHPAVARVEKRDARSAHGQPRHRRRWWWWRAAASASRHGHDHPCDHAEAGQDRDDGPDPPAPRQPLPRERPAGRVHHFRAGLEAVRRLLRGGHADHVVEPGRQLGPRSP